MKTTKEIINENITFTFDGIYDGVKSSKKDKKWYSEEEYNELKKEKDHWENRFKQEMR